LAGSHNEIEISATPDVVFSVLADPRTYPEWLVGAQVIRSVDDSWPLPGSQFHHRIGFGPASIPGSTTVTDHRPSEALTLAAGMGPFGEVSVRFVLTAAPSGTVVEVDEVPARGLARGAWRAMSLVTNLALWGRNEVSLSLLRDVVEAGVEAPTDAPTDH
jgi:carbon monoxide dehydrogenase subunit G